MRGSYDPWADIEAREDIDLIRDDSLPRGDGWWLPWLRLIVLRESLHPTHGRCVLAHELVHADHDDVQVAADGPDGNRLARRQETRANREAARRLIRLDHLVAALTAHPSDPTLVAHELDVTVDVLRCRLEHLRPVERRCLEEELASRENCA